MKWQPIETAPRDGTWILGYYAKGNWSSKGSIEGRHNCVVINYRKSNGPLDPETWEAFGACRFAMRDIRYWAPLPEPPEQ